MSPKPQLSMLLCMPFYLFTSLLGSQSRHVALGTKVTTFVIFTGIWVVLLMLPGNLFIRYVGANSGLLTLVLMNVYCHVETTKELFDEEVDGSHLLYDAVVSAGSVAAMLFAAFLPHYISHLYTGYTISNEEVTLGSLVSVICILNLTVTVLCKNALMSLPKASENYFSKLDLKNSHIVVMYYLALIAFFFILLEDKEFISTIRTLLTSL